MLPRSIRALAAMVTGCALALAAAPAHADVVTVSGEGVVDVLDPLVPGGTSPVSLGSQLSYDFSFDTAATSVIFDGGSGFQVIGLDLLTLRFSLGGVVYRSPGSSGSPPVVLLSMFNGPPTLFGQNFVLPGRVANSGRFATLFLDSTFLRSLGGATPGIRNVLDPGGAFANRFALTLGSNGTATGTVSGNFSGTLTGSAAVPEPGSWAVMILGFGLIGAAMRRSNFRAAVVSRRRVAHRQRLMLASGAAALMVALGAAPAQAEVVTVGGIGVVTGFGGIRGADGSLAFGRSVGFAIRFDPLTALRTFNDATMSVYVLNPSYVSAGLDGHLLALNPTNPGRAVLILRSAFMFFGGTASEAVLVQTFQFTGAGGPTAPAYLGGVPVTRDVLQFNTVFRMGSTTPSTAITSFRDPRDIRGGFFYRADTGNGNIGPIASASGQFDAAIVPALGGVPEPVTWMIMILGFGVIGGALRRARAARSVAPVAQSQSNRAAIA